MRSLRSRLVLGITLAAILPTVISLIALSNQIESAVRRQSVQRVDSALRSIRAELRSRAERLAVQVAVACRDPELRRHFLVHPRGPEMRQLLNERRALLGLDYLAVTDTLYPPVPLGIVAPPPSSTSEFQEPNAVAIGTVRPIYYRGTEVGRVAGGIMLTRSALEPFARAAGVELVVYSPSGDSVMASSLGAAAQASAPRRGPGPNRHSLARAQPLDIGLRPFPTLEAIASTEAADRTVTTLRQTAALVGFVGLLIAVLLGAAWSAQVARPVERLAAFSERVARGEWDEPLALKSVQELESLVGALDRMREDLRAYRDRLRVSERQAAWGQMARKVAHEIKNPLTPIAVSMEDLKRSFEQGRPDFPEILAQATRTVAEEVESMKQMLQELSDFGRLPAPRMEMCPWERVAANLDALYRRDVAEKRLAIAHPAPDPTLHADPGQIQQALVNLIQNGFDAAGPAGHVRVSIATANTHVEIGVADDGPGLTAEQRQNLFVPGFTTKEHGSGLGLTIVERIVNDHGGSIDVRSKPGSGTTIAIHLPRPASASREG